MRTIRLVRSVRAATAERLAFPIIRSLSQWPASWRRAALAGRSAMGSKPPSGLGFRSAVALS